MTNEECIKMLKSKLDGNTDTSYEWCECVRLAVKALEQQPEDCISRQAVLNLFNKSDEYRWETTWIRRKIEKLPSATPHKRGKWLDKKMTIKGGHGLAYGRYGCSVCKKKQPSKTNFCPNCGAKMEVEV